MRSLFIVLVAAIAVSAEEQVCEPKSHFKEYCNTCICSKDGTKYACTNMACDPRIFNKDGSLKAPFACEPGTKFNDYCNICTCPKNGLGAICTKRVCDPHVFNKDGSLKHPFNTIIRPARSVDQELVCEPGKEFKEYCNNCVCATDGSAYACTRKHCDKNVWNKDGTIKSDVQQKRYSKSEAPEKVCEKGATYKYYCNYCQCSEDETYFSCSKMYCDKNIWNEDGTMKSQVQHKRYSKSEEPEKVCEKGATYKYYCNYCQCSEDETYFSCSKMYCDKNIWNEDGTMKSQIQHKRYSKSEGQEQICENGKTYKYYCNYCQCSEDGTYFRCSKMFCDKNKWNVDGTLKSQTQSNKVVSSGEVQQVCEPFQRFKEYCNRCSCSHDGTYYTCSKMNCDKNVWNKDGTHKSQTQPEVEGPSGTSGNPGQTQKVCEPFQQFKEYCNYCSCSHDGSYYSCSKMFCDKNVWNKDGTLKSQTQPQVDGSTGVSGNPGETQQVCEPFQQLMKQYCNYCSCSHDGLYYTCSKMFCDKNVWNKDGTLKSQTGYGVARSDDLEQVCEPGQRFKKYCNDCVCNEEGTLFACTRKTCNNDIYNEDGTIKQPYVCEPGTSYKQDCNSCVCNEDGLGAACTAMACKPEISKNTLSDRISEDVDEFAWGPLYHHGDVCQVGEIFKSECNLCVCRDDGQSAYCTLMFCTNKQ